MSADKYPCIFSRQMAAIVYRLGFFNLIPSILLQFGARLRKLRGSLKRVHKFREVIVNGVLEGHHFYFSRH